MKRLVTGLILCFALLLIVERSAAQAGTMSNDSIRTPQSRDSLALKLPADSIALPADTVKTKEEKLTARVDYSAKDSIVFTGANMGYLYGEADVKYGEMGIKGAYITTNMDESTVFSTFGVDSLGKEFGYPVFSDKGTQYEMKKVTYNFKTEKAYISHVITEQGEGYIVANEAKKSGDNTFFMKNAKYTTCDLHEHPHFYLNLSKAKVRPGNDVVTGPFWLVAADVPLFPIVLPFAFFPFTDSYSSGILTPSYGDEMQRGFSLEDLGYYFAINDYVDLAVTGTLYTKGTWGVKARSNYKKRYKFSGNVDLYYLKTVLGDKEAPDYSVSKDFKINWTHSQDPKFNMYRTLSASVNFATSRADKNDLSSLYSRESVSNTKSSSVNLTQRFPNSPWNLSASITVNQISRDSTISATLPNLTASMSRIFPFKRKKAVGEERWYEKISMSYTGEFRNYITTKENQLAHSNLIKDWQNGIKHNIPVNATFNLLNYIQITPSFNYTERWYSGGEVQMWDPIKKANVVVDTIQGFRRVYNYSTSVSMSTKLYGFFTPWKKLFGNKIQTIRHVFTPSISLSYNPDFSDPKYNFYKTYSYVNQYGNQVDYTYSPYSNMIYGTAPKGKSGSIGFSFDNNVEMKIRTANDSTLKKSLIDALGISFSYNMMADSMKWSSISTNMRLKITKSYTLSLNATWDPYIYQLDQNGNPRQVDKLRIMNGKGFGKLQSTGTSFSYTIDQDTFKKWFSKGDESKKKSKSESSEENLTDDESLEALPNEEESAARSSAFDRNNEDNGDYDRFGYMKNNSKWNFSFNYSLRYGYGDFDKSKMEYKGKLTHNVGFSFAVQPTQNWNISFTPDYNFDLKKITNLTCNISRKLHCWSMSANFIPVGPYKSYSFSIRADASLLKDLKYDQRSSQYSSSMVNWY
ncbi:MAG: LPS-assembly protein LptD [Dysgonamonadaceae bacterium]|jgi:lipopolysaccharide assembly outer membrane protein LptD (OstA)|nr:LPS-assembly protein LptD [Dysgonamonadaceae bacterium]